MEGSKWVLVEAGHFQTTSTKTCLEHSMAKILLISKQYSTTLQKNLETNATSFKRPKIELLESGKKLGAASPWGGQTLLTEKAQLLVNSSTHGVYTSTGGLLSAFMNWSNFSKLLLAGWFEIRPGHYLFLSAKQPMI